MNKLQGIFFNDFANAYIPHILKEIYMDRIYDQYFFNRKDLIVLDVGANIGMFSYFAKDYAKQIFALEPSQQHFNTLTHMLAFNEIKNVTPLQLALADKNDEMVFNHNTNTTMFSLKPEINDKGETEAVHAVDIETLLNEYVKTDVDIMKLDVEGYECEIIASDAFERVCARIPLIVGEYHSWASSNPQQFKMMFTDRGYIFEWMNATEASTFVAKR